MTIARSWLTALAAAAVLVPINRKVAASEIPQHRVQQIWEAAPDKPRVAAKQPRRVLVWITPPHLMQRDPHTGYCIPYGTSAFVTLGKKTGAFETVVSGDLAMFLSSGCVETRAVCSCLPAEAGTTNGGACPTAIRSPRD